MDLPGEHGIPVVDKDITLSVRLHHQKEKHVLDVGRGHYTSALTGRSCWSDLNFFTPFSTDDGFGLVLVLGRIGVGDVSVESVPEELLHQSDLTIVTFRNVPYIRLALGVTLSSLPRAREQPLVVLIHDIAILDEHVHGPMVNPIVVGHHVVSEGDPSDILSTLLGRRFRRFDRWGGRPWCMCSCEPSMKHWWVHPRGYGD